MNIDFSPPCIHGSACKKAISRPYRRTMAVFHGLLRQKWQRDIGSALSRALTTWQDTRVAAMDAGCQIVQHPMWWWAWKYPQHAWNPVLWSQSKTFSENDQKPKKKSLPIFDDWNLIITQSKNNLNSNPIGFWSILSYTYKPNMRKIRWKLREPIWFKKKCWWMTTTIDDN